MAKTVSAKLVLLGDQAVGKTSLVLRYVNSSFSHETHSTVGASFVSKSLYARIFDLVLDSYISFISLLIRCGETSNMGYRRARTVLMTGIVFSLLTIVFPS